jgi:hypothetical protein
MCRASTTPFASQNRPQYPALATSLANASNGAPGASSGAKASIASASPASAMTGSLGVSAGSPARRHLSQRCSTTLPAISCSEQLPSWNRSQSRTSTEGCASIVLMVPKR